jgi:hypothetical protein
MDPRLEQPRPGSDHEALPKGRRVPSPFIARLTNRADGTVRGLAAYPDLRFKLVRAFSGVRSCVLECQSVNGLQAAEFLELDEDGLLRRVSAHYSEEP